MSIKKILDDVRTKSVASTLVLLRMVMRALMRYHAVESPVLAIFPPTLLADVMLLYNVTWIIYVLQVLDETQYFSPEALHALAQVRDPSPMSVQYKM
jgi:hypothetical protein